MKRYIISILLLTLTAYAGLVNGIALIINNEPVTLYDIDQKMLANNFTKQQAIDNIIDTTLYNQEIKSNMISVDLLDIDDYISMLASQNNMNALDFKALVSQQQDYNLFKENIKKQLLHQKLIKKIASGKLKIADNKDLKIYYENHIEQYQEADSFDIIAYVSKDKNALLNVQKNPLLNSDKIIVQNITLKQNELNPQVKYVLNNTSEKSFSTIFAQNQSYNMFFVSNKNGVKQKSFDEVKNQIFQKVMKQREDQFLKEYFETVKISADIKLLR